MQGVSPREFSIPCMDFEPVIRRIASDFLVFFKILFYLFLERGEGREKEREKHLCERNINRPPLVCTPARD